MYVYSVHVGLSEGDRSVVVRIDEVKGDRSDVERNG